MKLMCLQLCCHHIPVLHWDNVDLHFQAFALQIWFKKFLSWHQDSEGTVDWLQLVALYIWTMICSIWQRDLVYWLLLGLCWLLEVMLSPGGCWEWNPVTEERELDHLTDLIRKQPNHAKGTLLPVSEWVHPALFAFYFWKEPVLVAMYLWPMVFVCLFSWWNMQHAGVQRVVGRSLLWELGQTYRQSCVSFIFVEFSIPVRVFLW
jgi:hypothetical protein